jgi:3-deoxy-D-manno-octulosonic-acid transferase
VVNIFVYYQNAMRGGMERLFKIGYEIALWVLALVALPKMLYAMVVHRKYKKSFLARLGLRYPLIQKGDHPLIWIHAVSVGETKAVVALARRIKTSYPHVKIVISSTTETGHQEAKKSLPFVDWHVYLPLDFSWIVNKIMKQAKPDLVILSETDFWYNFLSTVKASGAPIAIVNGKVSQRSLDRLQKVSFFSRRLFDLIDLFCVQNNVYKDRFLQLGISPSRLVVTGNIKFDDDYPTLPVDEIQVWRNRLGIAAKQPVLTIGSTHNPEEKIFLNLLKQIWKEIPNLKVILVPRHPERFKEVANLLEKERVPFIRFSDITKRKGSERLILMDAMGLLRMCYQLADLALVGGSYTPKIGGHNILEPSWYGLPVLFGPYMHAQPELVELMKEYRAGWQLGADGLQEKIIALMKDQEERVRVGQEGLRLIADLKGGTQRTLTALQPLLQVICEKSCV